MTYSEERHDQGGSFLIGLLAGTVVGAGLGLLLAPKPGSDLRHQIAEQADAFKQTASEGYQRAADAAGDLANRGRAAMGSGMEEVSPRATG